MLYTPLTNKAMQIAYTAHHGQVDKGGLPYIFHPYHLAEQMTDEDTTVAALLHDVVEDTDYTLEDLKELGFSPQVLVAVALLTHEKEVPYLDYVNRLKDNPIAKAVKLADLEHNSDMTRLGPDDPRIPAFQEKYRRAKELLCE